MRQSKIHTNKYTVKSECVSKFFVFATLMSALGAFSGCEKGSNKSDLNTRNRGNTSDVSGCEGTVVESASQALRDVQIVANGPVVPKGTIFERSATLQKAASMSKYKVLLQVGRNFKSGKDSAWTDVPRKEGEFAFCRLLLANRDGGFVKDPNGDPYLVSPDGKSAKTMKVCALHPANVYTNKDIANNSSIDALCTVKNGKYVISISRHVSRTSLQRESFAIATAPIPEKPWFPLSMEEAVEWHKKNPASTCYSSKIEEASNSGRLPKNWNKAPYAPNVSDSEYRRLMDGYLKVEEDILSQCMISGPKTEVDCGKSLDPEMFTQVKFDSNVCYGARSIRYKNPSQEFKNRVPNWDKYQFAEGGAGFNILVKNGSQESKFETKQSSDPVTENENSGGIWPTNKSKTEGNTTPNTEQKPVEEKNESTETSW
jgi:hypothetical protein